jgi:hypothetical protein
MTVEQHWGTTGGSGHQGAAPRPVPVEITNAEALAGLVPRPGPRKHVRAVYRTFVFTAAAPVLPVAAEDLSRDEMWLIAYGNSVVICESQSQAQDPDNQIAGTGVFANTPANPQGTLLYVPSGAAFASPPSPISVRWTFSTTEVVWATALAFPTMLAVTLINRV